MEQLKDFYRTYSKYINITVGGVMAVLIFFIAFGFPGGKKTETAKYSQEQAAVVGFLTELKEGRYDKAATYTQDPTLFKELANLKLFPGTVENVYVKDRPLLDFEIQPTSVDNEEGTGKILTLTLLIKDYSKAGANYLHALNQDVDELKITQEIEKGFLAGEKLKVLNVPVEVIRTEKGNYTIKLSSAKINGIETTMDNFVFFNSVMYNRILSGYAQAIQDLLDEEIPEDQKAESKQKEDGVYDADYFDQLIEKGKEDEKKAPSEEPAQDEPAATTEKTTEKTTDKPLEEATTPPQETPAPAPQEEPAKLVPNEGEPSLPLPPTDAFEIDG